MDTLLFLVEIAYLTIILRKYRYNTFLLNPDPVIEARMYWTQYTDTFINEGLLLWIISTLFWIKAYN